MKFNLKPQPDALPHMPDVSAMTIGNRIAWMQSSLHKGRGVFALVDFHEGEVIEQSPVTVIPKAETDLIDGNIGDQESVLDQYLLRWRPQIKGQEYCMGHGYLMLYNHAPTPNAYLKYDFEFKSMSMVAGRTIKTGEEITFDYDCEIWFDVA